MRLVNARSLCLLRYRIHRNASKDKLILTTIGNVHRCVAVSKHLISKKNN